MTESMFSYTGKLNSSDLFTVRGNSVAEFTSNLTAAVEAIASATELQRSLNNRTGVASGGAFANNTLDTAVQALADAGLNPSPVGAQGLAQVMPGTFRDIMRETNIRGNPYDPYTNLMAGAYYMGKMRRIFRAPRPDVERHKLAAASYNAGAGHIIRAQALVGNPKEWKPVADVLPQITGRHAKETQNYVERIFRTYQTYSYGLNN
jgi:hypothetical protein